MNFELTYGESPYGDYQWMYGNEYAGLFLGHVKPTKNQMRKWNKMALFLLAPICDASMATSVKMEK